MQRETHNGTGGAISVLMGQPDTNACVGFLVLGALSSRTKAEEQMPRAVSGGRWVGTLNSLFGSLGSNCCPSC